MGVIVIDICLQQPICDDVILICINLLTFVAVIYSYKTLFLFIFSAQICVLKHQNSLTPGEGAKPLPQTPPPSTPSASRYSAPTAPRILAPHLQNRGAALEPR